MRKLFNWLFVSNRWKHLVGCFIVSLFGTALMGIGCAGGMEFKDVHHDNGNKPIRSWSWKAWDWLDFMASFIGCILAVAVHALVIWLMTL